MEGTYYNIDSKYISSSSFRYTRFFLSFLSPKSIPIGMNPDQPKENMQHSNGNISICAYLPYKESHNAPIVSVLGTVEHVYNSILVAAEAFCFQFTLAHKK